MNRKTWLSLLVCAILSISAAARAVTFGWQELSDGGIEYLVQVEPDLLDSFHKEGFASDIPSGLRDIRRLPIELRVVLILCDLSISLVIQGLVNAGIFTDAAVQAKLNEIAGSTYPTLPDRVPAPDPDSGYVPPDPDLGS